MLPAFFLPLMISSQKIVNFIFSSKQKLHILIRNVVPLKVSFSSSSKIRLYAVAQQQLNIACENIQVLRSDPQKPDTLAGQVEQEERMTFSVHSCFLLT